MKQFLVTVALLGCLGIVLTGCGGDNFGTVTVELIGDGTSEVSGEGIQCPGNCERTVFFTNATTFPTVETITLNVTTQPGTEFLGWKLFSSGGLDRSSDGDNCGMLDRCTLTLSSECSLGGFPPFCGERRTPDAVVRVLSAQTSTLAAWDTGGYSVCLAKIDGEVKCWLENYTGDPDFETRVPPRFVDPQAISVYDNYACVLDQTGLHCWSSTGKAVVEEPSELFNLSSIESFMAGTLSACAVNRGELVCWRSYLVNSEPRLLETPVFNNEPTNLRRMFYRSGTYCADDGAETRCWSWRAADDVLLLR